MLTRPCEGRLSDETLRLLRSGGERTDWGVYPCEICGQSVGVVKEKGQWVTEKHWPSVVYAPRKAGAGRSH